MTTNIKYNKIDASPKIYENIDEIALKNPNSNLIGIGMIVNNYIHVKRLINFNE